MEGKKTILICPLDWGLGHASRCVPLIRQFLGEGHEVIIGADKNPMAFLKQEFPQLKTVVVPGYEVTYGKKGSSLKLFYESVRFFNFIKEEHTFIQAVIDEHKIDVIISDNRYGLWSEKVKSIIISHQLFVKAPVGKKVAHHKIEKLIGNFDECWIPDVDGADNLSGDLAHLKPIKLVHKFIGPLSRFSNTDGKKQQEIYDVIAIISGPEPQRSIFEKLVLEEIYKNQFKAVVVRGLPDSQAEFEVTSEEVMVFNHLPTEQLEAYIVNSKMVVCRSGYSSIMDLAVLGKSAILVPTPGQSEQAYLAKHHEGNNRFCIQKQKELNLKKGLKELNLI